MTVNLVTGAAGFAGQHLVAELLQRGESVVGVALEATPRLSTLSPLDADRVTWVEADVQRRDDVRDLIRSFPVDRVFHLAALSSVSRSTVAPEAAISVNVLGTLHLLEEITAARSQGEAGPTVLISGSAEVYGAAASAHRPLSEDCPLEPLSPYAVSKAAQEMLGLQYGRTHRLPVVIARSFNHTGPGQLPPFVVPQLALQLVRARERGPAAGPSVIKVGNPEIRRDFTDVRDVVRAYVALAEKGRTGSVYNVCSGRSYSIGQLLQLLAEIAAVEVEVEVEPTRARRVDVQEVLGDASRLREATGWRPQIEIRDTLTGLLESLEAAAE